MWKLRTISLEADLWIVVCKNMEIRQNKDILKVIVNFKRQQHCCQTQDGTCNHYTTHLQQKRKLVISH